MPKFTEYPQKSTIADNDIMLIDGGTTSKVTMQQVTEHVSTKLGINMIKEDIEGLTENLESEVSRVEQKIVQENASTQQALQTEVTRIDGNVDELVQNTNRALNTLHDAIVTNDESLKESLATTTGEINKSIAAETKSRQDQDVVLDRKIDAIATAIRNEASQQKTSLEGKIQEASTTASTANAATNKALETTNTEVAKKANKTEVDESLRQQKEAIAVVEKKHDSLVEYIDEKIKDIDEKIKDIDEKIKFKFALERDDKIYATKIYKYAYSTSSNGEKLLDNVGLIAEPSTQLVRGHDDYQNIPLFKCYDCNFIIDENGDKHVTAIEGDENFSRYGKVDVGVLQMSAYWKVEDHDDYQIVYWASKPNHALGLEPWRECVRADGTIAPYMIHTKYMQGVIDGIRYSSSGLKPERNMSYDRMMTYYSSKGVGYKGGKMIEHTFRYVMLMLKYAAKNSQNVMAGCTSWNYQYYNTLAENDVNYVTITSSQAANLYVGGYVSVGELGVNTNLDRGQSYIHNLADDVKITDIVVEGSNARVYVDNSEFNTTTTTLLTSMHCRSGMLDCVLGVDGSFNSNTNGKSSMKIQGIECMVGGYEVFGDVVLDITGAMMRDVYVAKRLNRYTDIASIKANYNKIGSYTLSDNVFIADLIISQDGNYLVQNIASGDKVGTGDRHFGSNTYTSGQQEYLQGGDLGNGSNAGFAFLNDRYTLGVAYWLFLARV